MPIAQAKAAADELLLRSDVGFVARVPTATVMAMLRNEILCHIGTCDPKHAVCPATVSLIESRIRFVYCMHVLCLQPSRLGCQRRTQQSLSAVRCNSFLLGCNDAHVALYSHTP